MVTGLLRILGQAPRLHSRSETNRLLATRLQHLVDNECLESTLKQSLVDVGILILKPFHLQFLIAYSIPKL